MRPFRQSTTRYSLLLSTVFALGASACAVGHDDDPEWRFGISFGDSGGTSTSSSTTTTTTGAGDTMMVADLGAGSDDTAGTGGDPPTPNPLQCCNFDDQMWILVPDCTDPDPNDDYDITPRPQEDCDDEEVCCDDGITKTVTTELHCNAFGHTIVNDALCGTVCCAELTNGIWQTIGFMAAHECLDDDEGTREVVPNERCFEDEDTICDCDNAVDPGFGGECIEGTCAWFGEGDPNDPTPACHCSWTSGGSTG